MGLLTDSHQSPNKRKLRKYLIKYKSLICAVLYVAGIAYFCSLAHSSRNNATYFSENALLPGKNNLSSTHLFGVLWMKFFSNRFGELWNAFREYEFRASTAWWFGTWTGEAQKYHTNCMDFIKVSTNRPWSVRAQFHIELSAGRWTCI